MESERGVSALNMQKTDLHNRLKDDTLDAIIGVGLDERGLKQFPFSKVA